MPADYYAHLGAKPSASDAELKAAYRRRVRETHPDMGGDAHEFRLVQEAWETLGDPKARATYDRKSQTVFDSSIFSEPQFHPGSPFDGGSAFPGFSPGPFDAAAQRMAEQVRRMAAEHAQQRQDRAQFEREVADLRRPSWPLSVGAAHSVFGSLYASHRYAGIQWSEVSKWRSRDAWYVRVLTAAWLTVVVGFFFPTVLAADNSGLTGFMTWLFVVFAATFVGLLAAAGGLIGTHIVRWLNYTIPRRT
jgi:curved DNA-binding protein CbpA